MKYCGIVCEYDPFHNGHLYQIKRTRELFSDEACIICCMSGNFTQRGEAALLPKHIRARQALLCGADLVIELPSAYALLSAEGFAKNAVFLLSSLGIVTDLSFGAETSDTTLLTETAELLCEHETAQKTLMGLKTGISYAAAREKALYSAVRDRAEIISHPNNILAVEYIKAIKTQDSDLTPHAIERFGAVHDGESTEKGFASASRIRELVRQGELDSCRELMPEKSYELLENAVKSRTALTDTSLLSKMMYSYLLRLSPSDFSLFPDVSEGLEYRIHSVLHSCQSLESAIISAKTKRYPLTRIKRILMRAYLGLDAEKSRGFPPYCRILGFSDRGRQALSLIRESSEIPVITKPAHIKQLSLRAKKLFENEVLCTDLYFSAIGERTPSSEWRSVPENIAK